MPPIMPEPPEQPAPSHDTAALPPLPVRPTAGTSPLVDRISSDTVEIRITPAFGGLLHLQLVGNHGMPEIATGALRAVTIYGDRIEYHVEALPDTLGGEVA